MDLDELKDYTNQKNAYMIHSGITVLTVAPDRVTAQAVIGPDSLNAGGGLHGGVYFTLADAASGVLCRADGRKYVTECADIRFLKGVREGVITANAVLIRRGRRSCVVQVDIADSDGNLLALFTANFACIGDDYHK
ncbi:PaaI family thioesterase [uncultured Intestinimonas sp.]|uniref:PaaI family thioesterase n=1 Tax=uncultured Intestinimonas sp. TaxID=1689265 RepID=UPI0025E8A48E|nr:PaaI family thioesterase [uncultured Intestinimonas sp.]